MLSETRGGWFRSQGFHVDERSASQGGVKKEFRLALDDTMKFIDDGKEERHLTYNEENDLIPRDIHPREDPDDLFRAIGTQGIDVLEGRFKLSHLGPEKKLVKEVETSDESSST